MRQSIQEWTKESLWKTAFKKSEGIWSAKGCLPQILLGPFLSTLSRVTYTKIWLEQQERTHTLLY